MESQHFDAISRSLATLGTRRGVLRRLPALPVVGALLALLEEAGLAKDRRRRTKDRHHDRQKRRSKQKTRRRKHKATDRQRKQKRKQNARKRQKRADHHSPRCVPDPVARTCAGRCASVTNNCGTPVDCGPCPCSPPCGDCQTCRNSVCEPCGGATCCEHSTCPDPQVAIDAAAEGDTVTLCAGTWPLTTTLSISRNLTLAGAGAEQTVLDGQDAIRVLIVGVGANVTLQDLTITQGFATGGTVDTAGGGIQNQGTLSLAGAAVTDSDSGGGGGIGNRVGGTLILQAGSRVEGNTSFGVGSGGGIWNDGTVTLQAGSQVSGNSAKKGGGILNRAGGKVTLEDGSRVSNNLATEDSGGIWSDGATTVTVEDGALVCDNTPATSQCTSVANCPSPATGVCPPDPESGGG